MAKQLEYLTWVQWLKAVIDAWSEAERYGEKSIMAKDGVTITRIHEDYLKQHLDCQLLNNKQPSNKE